MKTNKLSLELTEKDFPNTDPIQLWVRAKNATVTLKISKYGIDLVSWIDRKNWPKTKVSKKTYQF